MHQLYPEALLERQTKLIKTHLCSIDNFKEAVSQMSVKTNRAFLKEICEYPLKDTDLALLLVAYVNGETKAFPEAKIQEVCTKKSRCQAFLAKIQLPFELAGEQPVGISKICAIQKVRSAIMEISNNGIRKAWSKACNIKYRAWSGWVMAFTILFFACLIALLVYVLVSLGKRKKAEQSPSQ
jgi:hypothetical protein